MIASDSWRWKETSINSPAGIQVYFFKTLIPVAGAMETTGAADLLASGLLDIVAQGNAVVALVLVLVVTMTLSDFMNNAATAAVMAPIAIGAAGATAVRTGALDLEEAIGLAYAPCPLTG